MYTTLKLHRLTDLPARILRYLAAIGLISACSEAAFKANRITKALSEPGFRAGVDHQYSAFAGPRSV